MSAQDLIPGANLALPAALVVAELAWSVEDALSLCCCLLGADGKVRDIADLIGPGRTESVGGEVRMTGLGTRHATFEINVPAMPGRVQKVSFCAVAQDQAAVDCGRAGVEINLASQGSKLARFRLPEERQLAAVIGELYQRNGAWKFRAIGQGYQEGLAPLAQGIGCTPADLQRVFKPAPTPPAAKPPPRPAPPAPPASDERLRVADPAISPPLPPPRADDARAGPGSPAERQMRTAASPSPDRVPRADGETAAPPAFTLGGWALTARGVVPADARRTRLVERELLDLKVGEDGARWPSFFAFDPLTGAALPETPPLRRTLGRSIGEEGWPELGWASGLDVASRQDETIPEGARFFAAGGSPARLVALNVADGQAWWKAPLTGKWFALGRFAPAAETMPFAFGAVGTREGVFFGNDGGLVHVLADQQPTLRQIDLGGTPIGPAAVLQDSVLLPVDVAGEIRIAVRDPGGALDWIPVEGAPTEPGQLGAPVANAETGLVYWPGTAGFLLIERTEEQFGGRWHPWPPGVAALPFLRPYRAKNGRLWMFGTRISSDGLNRGAAVACCMTLKGARDVKDLPGPFLSVGSQTFRVRERYADPWGTVAEEITLDYDFAGWWVMPILRIGSRETVLALMEDLGPGQGMREFLFREAPARPRQAALAVHRDQAGLAILGQRFTISAVDDLEIFLDGDRLCVHHFESNQCASWRLSSSR
ncbi:MAG: TerD family protein [Alphaproteobacteria bacterium]|nr:TerD family protein [Alphaproteobacteria bacterium]